MKDFLYLAIKIFIKGSKKSIYSLFGIILGITVLVISYSLMDGYRELLEKNLKKIYPPILLRSQGSMIPPDFLIKRAKILKEDFFEGLAISKVQNLSVFSFCRAIEGQREVIIGKDLADYLKIKEGDRILLYFKRGQSQKLSDLKVDLILKFGISFIDESYILLPFDILKEEGSSFGIYPLNSKKQKEIEEFLKDEPLWFSVTFNEITKDILTPLKIVEWSIGAVLSLITFVSAFHLITKLLLDMKERKMTFAILYALGMKPQRIFFSFFIYSFFLGLVGILIGILAGMFIVFAINALHLFSFKGILKGVYFVNEIILKISPQSILFIFSFGISLILILSIFIYFILKRMKIVESLRFE